jgi:hypothetical protein
MRFFRVLAVAAFLAPCTGVVPAAAQSAPGAAMLRVMADVVTSARNGKGVQGAICVTQSIFAPGDTIIFRALVSDADGTPLSAVQLTQRGVKVLVTTGEGAKIPLVYEQHPPPQVPSPNHDMYFAAAYPISRDHPTGTLSWTMTVTDGQGHTVSFTPIGQAAGVTTLQIVSKADPAAAK